MGELFSLKQPNILIYFMLILECLAVVVARIQRLQEEFLWQGRNNSKKFHLVKWSSLCKPKSDVGLGFKPLKLMNQALLGKWLWRIGDGSEGGYGSKLFELTWGW